MGLADRLGKRRAIAAGMVASALAYLALPLLGSRGLELALGALFFAFITFEFTIVASIPLMTELLPAARGRVMSANVAAHAAGRMLGALAGGALFHLGFVWVGGLSAGLNLAALAVILILVRERR
jgi:predicted MFS family arabinose efflux permease